MFRKKRRKALALLLAFAMLFATQSVPAMAAQGDAKSISGGGTISEDGVYEIAEKATGVVTIAAGVKNVTLIGGGVSWEGDTMTSEPFTDLRIDCTAAEGVALTLQDVYLVNTAAADQGPAVDFAGRGNRLLLEGINLIEKIGSGRGTYAAIHVPQGAELTVAGTGTLYFYKSSGGAGFGGNAGKLNGDIIFGDSGAEGPVLLSLIHI